MTTNSFGEIKARRDFLPFGEELYAGLAGRNTGHKYSSSSDDTRKKFATYQRDVETGLDFAQSRYYSPMHGRFTSPDEFKGGPDELFDFEEDASVNPTFYADLENPQSLNKYQYGYNNPYKYNDPSGHCPPVIVAGIAVACLILTTPDTIGPRPQQSDLDVVIDLASMALPPVKFGGPLVKEFLKGGARTVARETAKQSAKQVARQTTKQTVKQTTKQTVKQTTKTTTKLSKVQKTTSTKTVGSKFRKKTKIEPGKGPGQSRAEYVTIKTKDGRTIRTYKDSYDRANKFRHRKPLRGGPEGRPQD